MNSILCEERNCETFTGSSYYTRCPEHRAFRTCEECGERMVLSYLDCFSDKEKPITIIFAECPTHPRPKEKAA